MALEVGMVGGPELDVGYDNLGDWTNLQTQKLITHEP